MDAKNWLEVKKITGTSNSPSSKCIDMEIPIEHLDYYAEFGKCFKQLKLPCGGCYLVRGWFNSIMGGKVYVRLSRVPVDREVA